MARPAFRALALLAVWFLLGVARTTPATLRIVSLDGTTTETIAALGAQSELVGRDDSSTYPPSVTRLPSIGYQFTLSAEGILSLHPTLVIGRSDAQPVAALQQLRSAGVRVDLVAPARTLPAAERRIFTIGALLNRASQAKRIVEEMRRDDATLQHGIATRGHATPARVLVFLAISSQSLLACGPNSGPGAMVALVDAVNALPAMRGCKAVSPEAIVAAAPDVIVALAPGPDVRAGAPALAGVPAIAQTPAGRAQRLFTFDALFFAGFGPRTVRAATDLFDAIDRTR